MVKLSNDRVAFQVCNKYSVGDQNKEYLRAPYEYETIRSPSILERITMLACFRLLPVKDKNIILTEDNKFVLVFSDEYQIINSFYVDLNRCYVNNSHVSSGIQYLKFVPFVGDVFSNCECTRYVTVEKYPNILSKLSLYYNPCLVLPSMHYFKCPSSVHWTHEAVEHSSRNF